MNIDEKNAVIAEFDGFIPLTGKKVTYTHSQKIHRYWSEDSYEWIECNKWYPQDFEYDKNWNWLMPVVKEIQELKICKFELKKPIMNALMSVDINELHEAVFNFINNDL